MNGADDPLSTEVTILAALTDDAGRSWLVLEERRLSLLLVEQPVAEGMDYLLSPDLAGSR